jgi:ParB/RepB/Spo0J family partition protein
MNAPTTAAALSKPSLQLLAIASIVPSKSHVQGLRRARFNPASLQKLADDIKRNGLLQHPLARPLDGKHELVAGERRWLAAKLAGLKEIFVNVRELTDDQALEAQLSENLQREDLHPLEEAEGYEELMKLKKITADQVAEMIGQSRSYVYGRLKLIALCPEARKAFYAGDLDASKALLIARIGHHDTQRQALKDLVQGTEHEGPPANYRDAHKHILENYMLKLSTAPFDIKDATLLPKAGACGPCPKRTGNQVDLFGDVKNADICTDPKCFDDKRQAHHAVARKALEAKGRNVIYGADAKKLMPHWENNDNGYIAGNAYVKLDQNEYFGGRYQPVAEILGKDYVPTLIQHPLSGKFIEVAPRSTVASKASAKAKERTSRSRSSSSQRPTSPAAKKADIEKQIERQTIGRILKALHDKINTLGKEDLIQLAIRPYGWDTDSGHMGEIFGWKKNVHSKAIEAKARGMKPEQLLKMGFLLHLSYEENSNYDDEPLLAAAKRYKIDPNALRKEVEAALRKPKLPTSSKPTWSTPAPSAPATKSDFLRPMQPSDQLAQICGAAPITRVDITKKIWGYIKRNGLQDKKNRRMINADDKLAMVFAGKKQLSMFEMTKHCTAHTRRCTSTTSKGKGKKK